MHLVQLLLPLVNSPESDKTLHQLRGQLIERFGGITAYTRSPAKGAWVDDGERVVHDDVIIVEVMTEELDADWWRDLRTKLEEQLDQDLIVIRSTSIELL